MENPIQLEIINSVPGIQKVLDWFGEWPSFHDSEIVCVELNRVGTSRIEVHAFKVTNSLDSRGHFINEKHAVICFLLENVLDLELFGFNHQNVISGLNLKRVEEGYELHIHPCYGVQGHVIAGRLAIELKPGIPSQSVYSDSAEA